jgi:hypothetical protein
MQLRTARDRSRELKAQGCGRVSPQLAGAVRAWPLPHPAGQHVPGGVLLRPSLSFNLKADRRNVSPSLVKVISAAMICSDYILYGKAGHTYGVHDTLRRAEVGARTPYVFRLGSIFVVVKNPTEILAATAALFLDRSLPDIPDRVAAARSRSPLTLASGRRARRGGNRCKNCRRTIWI